MYFVGLKMYVYWQLLTNVFKSVVVFILVLLSNLGGEGGSRPSHLFAYNGVIQVPILINDKFKKSVVQ